MENVALNLLPMLQSNTVTVGLALNTGTEAFYRAVAEHNFGALALDVFSAGLLGLATAGLPEVGIHTSPELIAYAAAIGFNLPTIIKVLSGDEKFWSSALPMGASGAALGLVVDTFGAGINGNHLIKRVGHSIRFFSGK